MFRPNTRSTSGSAPTYGHGGSSAAPETSPTCRIGQGTGRGTGRGRGTRHGTGHGTGHGTAHRTGHGIAQRGRGMAQKSTVDSNKNASTPPTCTRSTPSSASWSKSKSATPSGLSAQKNLLKELAAKKKVAAALAPENGKKGKH